MSIAAVAGKRPALLQMIGLAGLLVGLAASLQGFLNFNGFWEDEFFQVAFLNEPLPYFFIEVLRLDQHPPFHFLQLKLWALFFDSDRGLMLNSLAWHLVSCLVIFRVGRAWLGSPAAWLAVGLFALSPQVASASVNLRMYAMVPALAVASWWLQLRLLTQAERRWWPWLGLGLLELALGYSHAIAVYFVMWISIAAAVQAWREAPQALPWKRWFAVQSVTAVLLLPLVIAAVVRIRMPGQSDAGGNNDPGDIVTHLGGMVAGWGIASPFVLYLGFAVFLAAILLGVWHRRTRVLALSLLVGPYAFAALVALFVAPLFKTPVYSAMLVPFACMALGAGLEALARHRIVGAVPALAFVAALALVVFPSSGQLLARVSPYQPLALEIKRRVQPGDVVVVAKPYLYWAVLRYAVGPDWGSPLEILPPLNENWQRMIAKIGPERARMLKLVPKTNRVEHEGVSYVIGEDVLAESEKARRVWLVERVRYPMPIKLAEGFADKGVVFEHGDRETTQLRLYARD